METLNFIVFLLTAKSTATYLCVIDLVHLCCIYFTFSYFCISELSYCWKLTGILVSLHLEI